MKKILLNTLFISLIGMVAKTQNLPDQSFENWGIKPMYEDLDVWNSTKSEAGILGDAFIVKTTDAHSGSYALRLNTVEMNGDTTFGFVVLGEVDDNGPTGGEPFAENVDSIHFFAKYDIMPQDSAIVLIVLKSGGTMIDFKQEYITGTQSSYTKISYDLNAANQTADSIIIAFASSNGFGDIHYPGSWIQIDSIHFTGATGNVPNHSFENWIDITAEDLLDWNTSNAIVYPDTSVEKSTDINTGTYSAKMTNHDNFSAIISYGPIIIGGLGKAPYNYSPTAFSGMYKANMPLTDTGIVLMQFFSGGTMLASHKQDIVNQSSYTSINIPISLPSSPDSLMFVVISGDSSGSEVYIDDFSFTVDGSTDLDDLKIDFKVSLFPNPVFEIMNIKSDGFQFDAISVFDLNGKMILSENVSLTNQHSINVKKQNLSKGNYLINLSNDSETISSRFIIK